MSRHGPIREYLEWDDRFSTGIATIDEQHKRLFALINELYNAMRAKDVGETIEHVFDELRRYTQYHFATEEKAFELYRYPQAKAHIAQHEGLLDELTVLYERYENDRLASSSDLLGFLTHWIKNHILVEDMMYVPYLGSEDI